MALFTSLPGTPAIPQFAEVVISSPLPNSNGGTTPVINILHLRSSTPTTAATIANLTTAVKTALNTALPAAWNVENTSPTIKARFMDDPTFGFGASQNMTAGAVAGDRLPTFNAVTIQLKTGFRGRNYRGSKHFAPLSEGDTTLDNLVGAAITRWQAVRDALAAMTAVTVTGGSTWKLIVLSTSLSDLTANPCLFTGADVTSCVLNETVGTMRHRKEKPAPV